MSNDLTRSYEISWAGPNYVSGQTPANGYNALDALENAMDNFLIPNTGGPLTVWIRTPSGVTMKLDLIS